MTSVISDDWQYIEHEFNGVELYDLNNDPDQLTNLAEDEPTILDELKNYYLEALTKVGLTWPYDVQK